jgi:CRP/FNR family cyclic AMP-dependent transcriptional regulator
MNAEIEPKNESDRRGFEAIESVIAEHPFLAELKPAHLRVLSQNAMRVRFKAGERIFREGDPANRFYLIERGKVSLEAHQKDESGVPIQTIAAGDVLGWSWLVPPYYWQFDARALEPTTAIFLYGTRLREECSQDQELGHELLKRIAAVILRRLQATRKQLLAGRATGG